MLATSQDAIQLKNRAFIIRLMTWRADCPSVLTDGARHVIGRHLSQETRARHSFDEVASNILESLRGGDGGGGGVLSVTSAGSLCEEVAPGVYAFPLFSDDYCAALIAEVEHFQRSGLPVRRPNSMNNYGLIVNEIGLEPMIDRLQREVLAPVAEALFPAQGGGALDSHHAFIVQYKQAGAPQTPSSFDANIEALSCYSGMQ